MDHVNLADIFLTSHDRFPVRFFHTLLGHLFHSFTMLTIESLSYCLIQICLSVN